MKSRRSLLTRVMVAARRLVGIALIYVAGLETAWCQTAEPSVVLLPEGQAVLSAGTALEKRVYARPALPEQAPVVIRGEGFTVDFRGVAASPGMPHGRDKIVLDEWGPVVPQGWLE